MAKTRIYLIIDGLYPTIHGNIKEAKESRDICNNGKLKKRTAMYCEFTEKDFKEGFANCQFKKI